MNRITLFAISLVFLGAGCAPAYTPLTDRTLWGVSVSPEKFDAEHYPAFFGKAVEAGQVLSWAGPWRDMAKEKGPPYGIVQEANRRKLVAVAITQPTVEDLKDASARSAFRDAVVGFARDTKPAFLGLGNEINRGYDSETVRSFADLFTETQTEIKKVAPHTQVFPIFQYEWLLGRRGGLFGGKDDTSNSQWDLLELFPNADLLAFTFYPALAFKEPADIPTDYFSQVTAHTTKPVAITETGWFREGVGGGWESDAGESADYVRRLPELLSATKPRFLIWPFLYDQAAAPVPFSSAGLLAAGQVTSPVWEAWKEIVQSYAR